MIKYLKNTLGYGESDEQRLLIDFKNYYHSSEGRVRAQIFWMVRNQQLCDELVQETFLKAWKSFDQFENNASFNTWIYRIASNVVHDHFRKNKLITEQIIDEIDSIAEQSQFEERDHISKCLLLMKSKHREVFILFFKFEMSLIKISELLEIPLGTVKSRLSLAKSKFKEIYEELGDGK